MTHLKYRRGIGVMEPKNLWLRGSRLRGRTTRDAKKREREGKNRHPRECLFLGLVGLGKVGALEGGRVLVAKRLTKL